MLPIQTLVLYVAGCIDNRDSELEHRNDNSITNSRSVPHSMHVKPTDSMHVPRAAAQHFLSQLRTVGHITEMNSPDPLHSPAPLK
jgi:hypothetical protein